MKFKAIIATLLATAALVSCDDTTEGIGSSLIGKNSVVVTTDSFAVTSKTIIVDSVLSRNSIAYLGHVKDPETESYITGDGMMQFHTLSNPGLPVKDSIVSRLGSDIIADSCEIFLTHSNSYGDTLTTMTLTACELEKPMLETKNYYSNFDIEANGYLRAANGIKKDQSYTLTSTFDNVKGIRIPLNDTYTDKNGNTYNNYGTYILQTYYAHPEYFQNSATFLNRVIPGFYFKNKSGLGAMAYVTASQLNIYYRAKINGKDSTRWVAFAGTEEVLQTTKITNDNASASRLANDATNTYLKTPAGLFTELTLPVNEIISGHQNDTINTVKLSISRVNNSTQSKYAFSAASRVIVLPKDSLKSFFEESKLVDNKTSYLTTLSANTYTFDNISNLITAMSKADKTNINWNKVVLVPVTIETTARRTSGGGTETLITKIMHDMSLTSTKLLKGTSSTDENIKVSVIYSKYNE